MHTLIHQNSEDYQSSIKKLQLRAMEAERERKNVLKNKLKLKEFEVKLSKIKRES